MRYSICLVCLVLAGCASARSSIVEELPYTGPNSTVAHYIQNRHKLDALAIACDGDQDQRLAAADSVMELIMQNHIQSDGEITIMDSDWDFPASVRLEQLVERFYDENIAADECRAQVQMINDSLLYHNETQG